MLDLICCCECYGFELVDLPLYYTDLAPCDYLLSPSVAPSVVIMTSYLLLVIFLIKWMITSSAIEREHCNTDGSIVRTINLIWSAFHECILVNIWTFQSILVYHLSRGTYDVGISNANKIEIIRVIQRRTWSYAKKTKKQTKINLCIWQFKKKYLKKKH